MPSQSFKEFVPDFSFAFFNVRNIDDRKVQSNVVLKFYVAIIKTLDKPELKELLPHLAEGFIKTLDQRTALEYVEIFFKYLTKSTEILDKDDYERALAGLPEGGRNIMNTLAEQWMREGYERAEQEFMHAKGKWVSEGQIKSAQDMLLDYVQDELDVPSQELLGQIRAIESFDILMALFRKARKLNTLKDFSREVSKALK